MAAAPACADRRALWRICDWKHSSLFKTAFYPEDASRLRFVIVQAHAYVVKVDRILCSAAVTYAAVRRLRMHCTYEAHVSDAHTVMLVSFISSRAHTASAGCDHEACLLCYHHLAATAS